MTPHRWPRSRVTRQELAQALPWRTEGWEPILPLTPQQILLDIRTELETLHRKRMLLGTTRFLYRPILSVELPMPPVTLFQAQDCCNKSTAVYNLRGFRFPNEHLHNFLFHSWNRPYKSNIEHGEFIAKVIFPIRREDTGPPDFHDPSEEAYLDNSPSADLVATLLGNIVELHRYLPDEVLRTLSRAEEYIDNYDDHRLDLDYRDMIRADK